MSETKFSMANEIVGGDVLIKELVDYYDFDEVLKYFNKTKKSDSEFFFKTKETVSNLLEHTIETASINDRGFGFGCLYSNGFIATAYIKNYKVSRLMLDFSISSHIVTTEQLQTTDELKQNMN